MKNLRKSVIVDDTKYNSSNSRLQDKTKSRIFNKSIKEDDFNKSGNKSKKISIKEIPEYPIEPSSQRTDKNLLLKQNKSRKSKDNLDI